MRRAAAVAAAALTSAVTLAQAGDRGDPNAECDGGTYQMVDCLGVQQDAWDKKMTEAYRDLLKYSNKQQSDQLRAAQRLWIKYRDANCLYYRLGEGSIARIEAAQCMRDMTRARAKELIQVNAPGEEQPGPDKPGKEDRN